MSWIRNFLIVVALVFVLLGNPSAAEACPNCKDALELKRAIAFGTSVLLLMSMPFVLGLAWYAAMFKAAQGQLNQSATHATIPPDSD